MNPVQQHYSRDGLFDTIVNAFGQHGITSITRNDIAGLDEFHVRGAAVSLELAREAGFSSNTAVLDVGCGIGGPCRMIASEFGCRVTGVDITAEYIITAKKLSELTGLQHLTTFVQADALQLPFAGESFDAVWTQHVQMNISNKLQFYSEIHRVLRPTGQFIYYDIFRADEGPLAYPLPWAGDPSISHLVTVTTFESILHDLGFIITGSKDQTQAGIDFFKDMLSRPGTKPGLRILMGADAAQKTRNLLNGLEEGRLHLQSGTYRKSSRSVHL
ncbi:MAG TPA: class I SAM-dependent methyltransferase [Chitinophagaceae bacterium]|nr:class I SAM-dependent methyltransferase [Chitinophagaceae bacterium]